MSSFYNSLSTSLSSAGISGDVIIGGDYNHNVSSFPPPPNWALSSAPTVLSDGTSQHQDNWMGSFDYFLHSSSLIPASVEAVELGFMPKVVEGYVQGEEVRDLAQFRVEEERDGSNILLYSDVSFDAGDKGGVVPGGDPFQEGMSDHLMVVGNFMEASEEKDNVVGEN